MSRKAGAAIGAIGADRADRAHRALGTIVAFAVACAWAAIVTERFDTVVRAIA